MFRPNSFISNNLGFERISALTAAATLIVLTALIPKDSWDGVIFAYGSDLGDYRGWLRFLDESGWEITAPIMLASEAVGQTLGTDYFFVLKLLIIAGIVGLIRETHLYVRTALGFSRAEADLVVAVLASSSVWVSLSGSPVIWHFLSIPLTLLAWRITTMSTSPSGRLSGLILVVIGSTVPTNVLVLAILSLFALSWEPRPNADRARLIWSIIPVLIAMVTQISIRVLNPTYGRYDSYNSILISFSEPLSNAVLSASFWFAITLAITLAPLAAISALYYVSDFLPPAASPKSKKIGRNQILVVIFGTLLIPFPYILIGKGPAFLDPWEGRHGFPLVIFLSIALLTGAMFMMFGRKAIAYVVIPTVCFGLLTQVVGHAMRLDRFAYEERLSAIFSKHLHSEEGGFVYVTVQGGPWPSVPPRYHYETQYLLFKATGSSSWLSTGNINAHLEGASNFGLNYEDSLRDIYTPGSLSCMEKIDLQGIGFGWSWNLVSRMFGMDSSNVMVLNHSRLCVDTIRKAN